MNKPDLKDSFSVDDIHKLREYNYEKNKSLTNAERLNLINKKAKEFKKEIKKSKNEKVAI